MRHTITPGALAAAVVLIAGCGPAEPEIRIDGAWSRPTTAAAQAQTDHVERVGHDIPGVAYLSIVNDGRRIDRLTGARSERCATVEIHQSLIDDGRMRMIPVEDGIEIEPGSTMQFSPGGHHLMLIGLHEPLRRGDRFEITLEFETTGDVQVVVEVRKP